MGSFYANIHVRTTDRAQVEQAWQGYWEGRDEGSRAFVAPPYAGWVSVFDWRSDRPDTDMLTDLAAHLSRLTDAVTLAFQVQDSALAEYWLFNHGVEVDHYTSNSEYFAGYQEWPQTQSEEGIYAGYGPDSAQFYRGEEDLTDGGDAGLLKTLARTGASENELEAILRTPAVIADEILTALASALSINDTWAAVGYQYLVTEGEMIPGRESFRHLPPEQPPLAERPPHHGD